jgi:hypothetical protein
MKPFKVRIPRLNHIGYYILEGTCRRTLLTGYLFYFNSDRKANVFNGFSSFNDVMTEETQSSVLYVNLRGV